MIGDPAFSWGMAALCLVILAAGCAPTRPGTHEQAAAPDAPSLLCPELAGNADPLEATYTDAPGANARIRTFVASARGLNDVTLDIERRAVDTCRAVAKDIGAPAVARTAPLDVQCAPIRAAVAQIVKEGIELRIAIAPPRCEADGGRKARCEAVAAAASAKESGTLCDAQATVYARCSMPAVSFAVSKTTELALALGKSLEANLPSMLYADLALGRRLVDHVSKIATASVQLTAELKHVGPHGLACIALASSVVTKSSARLHRFLDLSSAVVFDLDPEMSAP